MVGASPWPTSTRTVFVIGKDGRIVYAKPANPNAQVHYDELTAAIAAAKK